MRAVALAVLLAVLILLFGPARADGIAHSGLNWVQITLRPCADPAVLELLLAAGEDPAAWRAAHAELGGKGFAACWRLSGTVTHLVYEDGDQGLLREDELTPLKEA